MALDLPVYDPKARTATPKYAIKPRAVEKIEEQRIQKAQERACRIAVDKRDKHRCFFPGCKVRAGEKHHIVASSVRGKRIWQTDDILSACGTHHSWFKAGLIRTIGNPDDGPVQVYLTKLGRQAKIRMPKLFQRTL